jgi:hypothetical protein
MSVSRPVSHLQECRRHLVDLRARRDYVALTCVILRLEGAGGSGLFDRPFTRVLADTPFLDRLTAGPGDTFALAFYPVATGIQADRIPAALAPVEAITREVYPLLAALPQPVRERLRLPEGDSWWRVTFHLAWHFPRPFLKAARRRLLAQGGVPAGVSDETFIQLHGLGGRTDLLPGLIYSALEHDLCTCSEAAIAVILDALEAHAQADAPASLEDRTLSAEQRTAFDGLRAEFQAGAQIPTRLECKLLKLADSFDSPPATEWGGLKIGGCVERFLTLSKRNDQQELAQIRGPATEWFCQVAERAGSALPAWIPDRPILFDDPQSGLSGPPPVTNRNACERWVGSVFATLKQHAPEALRVTWGTTMGPLSYGFATLDRDPCAASVLAIDLAQLTTAAAEAADRERATCSPFTVPSMQEQGFQWAEPAPPLTPPDNYTLGKLVEDLRRFAENYCRAAGRVREGNPVLAPDSRIQLGADVSGARARLLAIPGFSDLREWVRSEWSEEITFAAGRRIVDAVVGRSRGRLSFDGAEGLSLPQVVARLTALSGEGLDDEARASGDELPAPVDQESIQRIISALENWKFVICAPPNEKPIPQDHVDLTNRIVSWRDRHAPRFDVTPLDEVRRILVRRSQGEAPPEEALRTAGEGAARLCDRIKQWLQTLADLLEEKTAGYTPSTELSRIIFELNNPRSDAPAQADELVQVPDPIDEARRAWLPILRDHIGKVPELAGGLTEEKLRRWLWENHKVPPTRDLYAQQLVALFNREPCRPAADQPTEFIQGLLDGSDDVELTARDMALLEAHLRQPISPATIQEEKRTTGHSPTEVVRNKLTLIRDFNRALQASGAADAQEKQSDESLVDGPTAPTRKRSTERGEGRAKLIAALTKHHQYADGSCLNLEHIGNNELAKAAGVSPSTASVFFNDKFSGHTKYKVMCRSAGKLAAALKLLNDEFAPYHLLGAAASDLAAPEQEDTDGD